MQKVHSKNITAEQRREERREEKREEKREKIREEKRKEKRREGIELNRIEKTHVKLVNLEKLVMVLLQLEMRVVGLKWCSIQSQWLESTRRLEVLESCLPRTQCLIFSGLKIR